jgi:hypothetical protein
MESLGLVLYLAESYISKKLQPKKRMVISLSRSPSCCYLTCQKTAKVVRGFQNGSVSGNVGHRTK